MPPTPVLAEVTGTVWTIELRPGMTVAADQTLMLLESMKMEIPVAAPRAGTLLELRVAEGDPVAEGQVVAVIG